MKNLLFVNVGQVLHENVLKIPFICLFITFATV